MRDILMIMFSFVLFTSCNKGGEALNNRAPGGDTSRQEQEMDTITYVAQVWVDTTDMERYGGEQVFKNDLKHMFRKTTRFWNESPNKFDYYFKFAPGEELHIYDIQGNTVNYQKFQNQAYGQLNTSKYDFVLFLALDADNEGLSTGGGGASGQSVVMAYFKHSTNIFTDAEYPDQGTYSNLGHEYGHVRSAEDLYQYKISAESNPISHQAFIPPPDNMGTGYMVWSYYTSALFNFTAHHKQLRMDFPKNTYPQNLVIHVTKDNKPMEGIKINFYGTRAGGYYGGPDVYNKDDNSPFLARTTNDEGEIVINNVYKMYHPDLTDPNVPPKSPKDEFPYSRWYCFLLEIRNGNSKVYMWLSDLKMRTEYLNTGNETYTLNISLK